MTDEMKISQVCQKETCTNGAILHVTHEICGAFNTWDVCGTHAQELADTLTALMIRYSMYAPGRSDAKS